MRSAPWLVHSYLPPVQGETEAAVFLCDHVAAGDVEAAARFAAATGRRRSLGVRYEEA